MVILKNIKSTGEISVSPVDLGARRGVGLIAQTSPLVGCLIISENDRVVGEGFYGAENRNHAETIALEMAGEQANNSTVYVTLEPPAHCSRDASCADALLEAGVRRVVVAMTDPNPLVAGSGIRILREKDVPTEVGLLEESAIRMNHR